MNTDHLPDYDIPWDTSVRPQRFSEQLERAIRRNLLRGLGLLLLFLGACSSPTDPSPYIVVVAGGLTTPSAPQQSDYAMGAN